MTAKYRVFGAILFLAGLFFIGSGFAYAQYDNGSLVGTIHDSSGAVVSGASVSATNTATGITEKATSNDARRLRVPFPADWGVHDCGDAEGIRAGDRAEHHDFGRKPAAH